MTAGTPALFTPFHLPVGFSAVASAAEYLEVGVSVVAGAAAIVYVVDFQA